MDWAIDLYLARQGKIHRTSNGHTVFGIGGVSKSSGAYRIFRKSLIELPIPFYRLNLHVIELSRMLSVCQRMKLMGILFKLNATNLVDRIRSVLY